MHVRLAFQSRYITLRRTDQNEACGRQSTGRSGDQVLIHPPVQASNIADDRARHSAQIGWSVVARETDGLEATVVDPERKHVDLLAKPANALAKPL
jgi:hypothetical protein